MQVGWYWLTQKLTHATHLIIFGFWVSLTQYKSQTSGTSVPDNYTQRDSCCYFQMNAAHGTNHPQLLLVACPSLPYPNPVC